MIDYDVIKIQKLFDEHGIDELKVTRVVPFKDCAYITVVQNTYLNEYVIKNQHLKKLLFKSSGKTYELLRFYVDVGGEKVDKVYILKEDGLIIDVIAHYEFKNAENFINSNLTLIIDEIISEEY